VAAVTTEQTTLFGAAPVTPVITQVRPKRSKNPPPHPSTTVDRAPGHCNPSRAVMGGGGWACLGCGQVFDLGLVNSGRQVLGPCPETLGGSWRERVAAVGKSTL